MTIQISYDIATVAQTYVQAGLSVLPIARGTKIPNAKSLPRKLNDESGKWEPTWTIYQERTANQQELKKWFATDNDNQLAIIGGAVSGGLVVLDIESIHAYERWRELAAQLIDAQLLDTLPVVATGKGKHIYFRMQQPIGNRKLAKGQDGKILIETRGEGGYVLAPPSLHPSGTVYSIEHGDLTEIPMLDAAIAQCLFDAARATATIEHPTNQSQDAPGQSVIDTFNSRHTIEAILERNGYTREPGKLNRYIRPGGERSSVLVLGDRSLHYNPNDKLYSESSSGQHAHSPFSAFCVLEHNGDLRKAVRSAAIQLGMNTGPNPNELIADAGRALGLGVAEGESAGPYFIHDGGIWLTKKNRDGTPNVLPLTNWTATITAETTLDSGDDRIERYTIVAQCGKRTRTIEIDRADFEKEGAVSRIVSTLGAGARVNPQGQAAYIIDAIKAFSGSVIERLHYTHTGWVKIEGQRRYLMANGYIDADGWHQADLCQLPQRLAQYQLNQADLQLGRVTWESLLQTAPTDVLVPLIGGVLLGPIAGYLDASSPMVHVYGPTGSHKTSLTCAALALWGKFTTPERPTDTWNSTAYSTQTLGWYLKDAPMLLDDYKAAHVKPSYVTAMLQNYGDGMARGRLDSNSQLRATTPIRGILISSGEDQPEGEASTLARILSIPLGRGMVDRKQLTAVQANAPALHSILISYIRWLCKQPDDFSADLAALHRTYRARLLEHLETINNATNPGRVAGNIASLAVCWHVITTWAEECQIWDAATAQAWMQTAKRELFALAKRQLTAVTEERYSMLFIEALRGLVASGRAVFEEPNKTPSTGQVVIGKRDTIHILINAQVAYDEVCRAYRAAGRSVTFSQRALSQMLQQDGLLTGRQGDGLTVRRRVAGVIVHCWQVSAKLFDEDESDHES